MNTAAAVLQEFAVKLGMIPEYECISQSGPHHQITFEYRCSLLNESTIASARSKKDAKQEAAQALLVKLSQAGHSVPPPWGLGIGIGPGGKIAGMGGLGGLVSEGPKGGAEAGAAAGTEMTLPGASVSDPHSYVALLREYCEEYKIPAPEYSLVGDSGPPHMRSFTVRVTVGSHTRDATATTKKAARQMSSETIYRYLRGCLRSTHDFVEVEALARSIDKKMGRYKDERKEVPWRPPLNQKISEYPYGLILQFDEEKRTAALEALRSTAEAKQPPQIQLACAAAQLGLELEWGELSSNSDIQVITVELPTTSPAVLHLGFDRDDAAANMIKGLLSRLPNPKTPVVLASMET